MANSISILKETYQYVEVLLRLDGTGATGSTLLDADALDFYDTTVPSSSDIQLKFSSAVFNLSGKADVTSSKSGGVVTLLLNHQTTDAEIITLTGNGEIKFSPSLPIEHPAGGSVLNFNGDINYTVGAETVGHVKVVFQKASGYYMSHNKWRKPGQANPYS